MHSACHLIRYSATDCTNTQRLALAPSCDLLGMSCPVWIYYLLNLVKSELLPHLTPVQLIIKLSVPGNFRSCTVIHTYYFLILTCLASAIPFQDLESGLCARSGAPAVRSAAVTLPRNVRLAISALGSRDALHRYPPFSTAASTNCDGYKIHLSCTRREAL